MNTSQKTFLFTSYQQMIHIKLQLRVPTPIQISPAKCSRNPVYIFCNFPLWLDFTCNLHAYVLNGVEFVETTRESIIEDPCEQIVHAVKIHAIPTVYLVANVCIGALLIRLTITSKGFKMMQTIQSTHQAWKAVLRKSAVSKKVTFFFLHRKIRRIRIEAS